LIGNGIIIAQKNAPFLVKWAKAYEDDYRPEKWVYNSCAMATKLWKMFPELVYIDKDTLLWPNWVPAGLNMLWGNGKYNWRRNYALHTYIRMRKRDPWYMKHYKGLYPKTEEEKLVKWTNSTMNAKSEDGMQGIKRKDGASHADKWRKTFSASFIEQSNNIPECKRLFKHLHYD
jgi:hypothetical protein